MIGLLDTIRCIVDALVSTIGVEARVWKRLERDSEVRGAIEDGSRREREQRAA